MLAECEKRCQMEFRVGSSSGYARCPEVHLEKSKDPERSGPCQLTVVKMNRSKKLFCQWHARALLRHVQYSPGPIKRPTVEDANQIGMFA